MIVMMRSSLSTNTFNEFPHPRKFSINVNGTFHHTTLSSLKSFYHLHSHDRHLVKRQQDGQTTRGMVTHDSNTVNSGTETIPTPNPKYVM